MGFQPTLTFETTAEQFFINVPTYLACIRGVSIWENFAVRSYIINVDEGNFIFMATISPTPARSWPNILKIWKSPMFFFYDDLT